MNCNSNTFPGRRYVCIALLLLLSSCTIEKRLYTGGYYISCPCNNHVPGPDENIRAESSSRISEELAGISRNSIPAQFPEPVIFPASVSTSVPSDGRGPKKVNQNSDKPLPIFSEHRSPSASDEEIEKDVKSLLIASSAVLFVSLLYVLFSLLGSLFLMDLLFILLPFSIIGLWMFALLLRNRYFFEPEKADKGKTDGKGRVITKKKAFLLAGFLGIFGAHRFYLGYTDIGLFELFTLGGFFVLAFIDMLQIKSGKLKPKSGEYGYEDPNYKNVRKKIASNRSQKLIKLSVLISLLALLIMLGFTILL